MERVQKIMAEAGIASRRKCEELIKEGRVKINYAIVKLGDTASFSDKITVDGKLIKKEEKVYIMLNKPVGYVTTVSEQHGMKTVMRLIKVKERLFPVGRLDKNTEGLLLITNDGELSNRLMHPSKEVWKKYEVWLSKPFKSLEKIKKGIVIDRVKVQPRIKSIRGKTVVLEIHEGRKHIVRKMFGNMGYNVTKLRRTQIGPLKLGKLGKGTWRYLKKYELKGLMFKR